MAPIGTRSVFVTAFVVAALALAAPACGGDDDDGGDDGDTALAVATACDRLEDVADAVLASRDAATPQAYVESIDATVDAFVDAAERTGDDELATYAADYRAGVDGYATATGIDARASANEADIALDRAGLRCSQLGATNVFPTEP